MNLALISFKLLILPTLLY